MAETKKKFVMTKKRMASYKKNFKARLDLPSCRRPNAKPLTFEGESRSIREWAEIRGVSYTAMRNRVAKYPPEIALCPEFSYEYAMKIFNGEINVKGRKKSKKGSK